MGQIARQDNNRGQQQATTGGAVNMFGPFSLSDTLPQPRDVPNLAAEFAGSGAASTLASSDIPAGLRSGTYGIDIPISSTAGQVAQSGDSWATLARPQYGDERYALALARANGSNSVLLKAGQTVYFPDLSGANLQQGGQFIAADAQYRAAVQAQQAQSVSSSSIVVSADSIATGSILNGSNFAGQSNYAGGMQLVSPAPSNATTEWREKKASS